MQNRFIQPKTSVIIETHTKKKNPLYKKKNKKLNETIIYKIVSIYIIQRHTEI